jgi:hypothetical protein
MQLAQQLVIPAEILSAGVDWITATSKTGGSKPHMEELAIHCFQRALDAGEEVKPSKILGYTGYASKHIFHGERQGGAIMRVSGAAAKDLWRSVSEVSDNVSRLDLQVTVWTILERPHVAKVIHEQIKRKELGIVPIRNATYIEGHPSGETVNLNKRGSACSARVYDKAAESGLGLPRTVWRYEIECHSNLAGAYLAALRSNHSPSSTTATLVHKWFERRGIKPLFNPPDNSSTLDVHVGKPERNTLQWFRDSLSKTVARQVSLYGRGAVMRALGLEEQLNPNCKEE